MILILAILAAVFWIPSPWGWVLVGVAAIIETAEIWFWWWWGGERRKTEVGIETFVGRRARVVTPCRPSGQVRLDGETWEARCEDGRRPTAVGRGRRRADPVRVRPRPDLAARAGRRR